MANPLTRMIDRIMGRERAATLNALDGYGYTPRSGGRKGGVYVTSDTALRTSAVWACLRLRADLISTMPVDVYRTVDGRAVEVSKPPVLLTPGGERVEIEEWMYSTQFDLDRSGNCFGLITERDALGRPARIDLVPLDSVTVRRRQGVLEYVIAGDVYAPNEVWHERQFTVAGLDVGLSPVAYAAWTIGETQSVQEFALDWFGNGAKPAAMLKNTAKTLTPSQSADIKDRHKATVGAGDVLVVGADWEYNMIQNESSTRNWIETKAFAVTDICRFFGVPADLVDGAAAGSSITYASITQRNLQFLIMHLGPAIVRREKALSRLTSRPRYVKLNANALLRMDPATRAQTISLQIADRVLTNTEARALEDRAPLTPAEIAEFATVYGAPNQPVEVPQ